MKRIKALILLLAFVVATQLVPMAHKACIEKGHDESTCSVCKVWNTPVVATEATCAPVVTQVVLQTVSLPQAAEVLTVLPGALHARAPPVA